MIMSKSEVIFMKKKGVVIVSVVALVVVGLVATIYAMKPTTVTFTKKGISNEKAWKKFIAETENGKERKINIVFEKMVETLQLYHLTVIDIHIVMMAKIW